MRKLTTRLIVALLILLLGVTAAAAWYLGRPSINHEVRLIVPDAGWEPIYFRVIDSVARLSGQTDLRKTGLAEGDLEVRVWWGGGLEPLEGVTLRRAGGQWSAIHVKADHYYEPQNAARRELGPPKAGWEAVWRRLVDAGILMLPDASEVGCDVVGLDGMAFVVETSENRTYRTYKYGSPMRAECNEAKQMMEIGDTLYEEFDLGGYRDSQ